MMMSEWITSGHEGLAAGRFLAAAVLLAVLGCHRSGAAPGAQPGTAGPVSDASVAAQYAPYVEPGTAAIDGQAYVPIHGGDVRVEVVGYLSHLPDDYRSAAGRVVTLDPATPYAMKWYLKNGTDPRKFSQMPPDAAFRAARRTTVADDVGRFYFSKLPAGRYIIRTTITWDALRDGIRRTQEGGVAAAVVDLGPGERMQLVINSIVTNIIR